MKSYAYIENGQVVRVRHDFPDNFDPDTVSHKYDLRPLVRGADPSVNEATEILLKEDQYIVQASQVIARRRKRARTTNEQNEHIDDLRNYTLDLQRQKIAALDAELADPSTAHIRLARMLQLEYQMRTGLINPTDDPDEVAELSAFDVVQVQVNAIRDAAQAILADNSVRTKNAVRTDNRWPT